MPDLLTDFHQQAGIDLPDCLMLSFSTPDKTGALTLLESCKIIEGASININLSPYLLPVNLINITQARYLETSEAKIFSPLLSQHFETKQPLFYWCAPVQNSLTYHLLIIIFSTPAAQELRLRAGFLKQVLMALDLKQDLQKQKKRYESYLAEVKTIKEKLLPLEHHSVEGIEYAVHYRPNIGGGGDYFDIMDLREARIRGGDENPPVFWGLAVFDVSGHGPGAAVEVAMIDAILRTYQGDENAHPGDVMQYTNSHFFTRQLRGDFVTGVMCNFNEDTRSFTYACAGHLPILVKRLNGDLEILENNDGIPIGIERDYHWETQHARLEIGDLVILMTDGITEAVAKNKEQFGFERVLDFFRQATLFEAAPLLRAFLQTFKQYTGETSTHDDETLIIIKITQ